ncbi:biotin--protein ligase-like [Dendronephthya gigantea]|uniref:biotin--protein ligase-like n=1 Tax=Dendronephthya gigantea TaxID=151771 RepID=UPI0010697425|nr:biotin--protein ligase-like [Dendronephthya gigantea]
MFALPYIFGAINRSRNRLFHFSTEYSSGVKNIAQKSGRPPNILVYSGVDDQSCREFQQAKQFLQQCLGQDKYVIYQLQHDLILQEPWKENTELLVLSYNHILDKSHENAFDSYVKNGGKLLGFAPSYTLNDSVELIDVDPSIEEIRVHEKLTKYGRCLQVPSIDKIYEVKREEECLAVSSDTSKPVILSVSLEDGMAILSTIPIFKDAMNNELNNARIELVKMLLSYLGITCGDTKEPVLTNAYLLGDNKDKEIFLKSIQDILVNNCFRGNNINIFFTENKDMPISNENFPVITTTNEQVSFSLSLYKEHLKTKHLGQLAIYTEVITSTQTILNGSLKLVRKTLDQYGLVLVGRQQTIGKGRGGNAWLSPDGCLSFSFPLHIELDTNLGERLPFVQHIAALAVVDAVRCMDGYEDIDLRLKWPNDIYFGKGTKIGGILVNSAIFGKNVYATIGIGVNLDNSEPTSCINDMIQQHNVASNMALRKLSREQLLARILNEMEDIVQVFQRDGPKQFLTKYYQRWLHSDAKVNLGNESGEKVTIKGLDDMGYLSVVNTLNEVLSVQPDGNSFDMMRNLITIKTRN